MTKRGVDVATSTGHSVDPKPDSAVGLYVYALMKDQAVDLAELVGVANASVHRAATNGIAAVVSEVPLSALDVPADDLSEDGPLAELASAHDSVVRAVFAQSAVLPLRLATVVSDAGGLVEVLDECRDRALARLDRLAGRREWGVRLQHRSAPDSPAPEGDDRSAELSGTAYLRQRRDALRTKEALARQLATLAEEVHDALAQVADDATASVSGNVLLNATYLVEETAEEQLGSVLERLGTVLEQHSVDLTVTGPWPPYSFARIDLTEVGDE